MAISTNSTNYEVSEVKNVLEELLKKVESSPKKRSAAGAFGAEVHSSLKRTKEVSLKTKNLLEMINSESIDANIQSVDANIDTLQTLTPEEAKDLLLEDARCNNSEILFELFDPPSSDMNFLQNGLLSALKCRDTVKSLLETDRELLNRACNNLGYRKCGQEIFQTCMDVLNDKEFPKDRKKSLLEHHDPLFYGAHIASNLGNLELLTMITPLLQNLLPEAIAKLYDSLSEECLAGDTLINIAKVANKNIPVGCEIYRIMTRGLTEISAQAIHFLKFDLEFDQIIKADQKTQSHGFSILLKKSLEHGVLLRLDKISHEYKALAIDLSNKMQTENGFLTDFRPARLMKEDKNVLAYLLIHDFVPEDHKGDVLLNLKETQYRKFFDDRKTLCLVDDYFSQEFNSPMEKCEFIECRLEKAACLLSELQTFEARHESLFYKEDVAKKIMDGIRTLSTFYLNKFPTELPESVETHLEALDTILGKSGKEKYDDLRSFDFDLFMKMLKVEYFVQNAVKNLTEEVMKKQELTEGLTCFESNQSSKKIIKKYIAQGLQLMAKVDKLSTENLKTTIIKLCEEFYLKGKELPKDMNPQDMNQQLKILLDRFHGSASRVTSIETLQEVIIQAFNHQMKAR